MITSWLFLERCLIQVVVGDIVKVNDGELFPADLLLLLSSEKNGTCLVETSKLDGETNLKLHHALDLKLESNDVENKKFSCKIECEPPNKNLKAFVGKMIVGEETYDLGEF